MKKFKKSLTVFAAIGIALMVTAGANGCAETSASPREQAEQQRNAGVEQVAKKQPVTPMQWSPTRDTINRWAQTWGQEGKVSYVYMQRADGEFAGYYVISGLPVNYCVSASPVDEINKSISYSVDRLITTAPALDAAYYGGCDASRYYGFDAVSGQYIEYTDGYVLTAVVSDSPLDIERQPKPYGSSIEDVKKN